MSGVLPGLQRLQGRLGECLLLFGLHMEIYLKYRYSKGSGTDKMAKPERKAAVAF